MSTNAANSIGIYNTTKPTSDGLAICIALIAGIPTLMYGIAAIFLIRYTESLAIDGYEKPIPIYFLYKEDKGAQF